MHSFKVVRGIVVLAALAAPATGFAQVYKCTGSGGMVYQSTPCPGAPSAPPHIAAPAPKAIGDDGLPSSAAALASMDVPQLVAARQANARARARLMAEYDEIHRALESDQRNGSSTKADIDRGNGWILKMDVLRRLDRDLGVELGKRCPKGVTVANGLAACVQ